MFLEFKLLERFVIALQLLSLLVGMIELYLLEVIF